MELLFLYGPPGVGKYTVGRILAKKIGYGLLHNHITVDLVEDIYTFGSPKFRKLNKDIRLKIIQTAVKHNVRGLIMTYALALNKEEDWKEVERFKRAATSQSGNMSFIELRCDEDVLFRRVVKKDRRHFHKIKSKKRLRDLMRKHVFRSSRRFPRHSDTLVIDTTRSTPIKTANQIITSLHLRRKR
ncbi:AAA family ATPase [Patescibacteria group bacterium]